MSYCRFGQADVYVYLDARGYLACCGCILGDEWEFHSTDAMVEHLNAHTAAGHDVPSSVIPALRADDAENFPFAAEAGASCPC
jgi:hypothetical protein